MTTQPDIITDAQNRPVVYQGEKGVDFFRARAVRSSIELYRKTGLIPTRGVTITKLLAFAGDYTGTTYKRNVDLNKVVSDLDDVLLGKGNELTVQQRA